MNSIENIKVEENVSLKNLNTYKIDAKARYLIHILSINGLIDTLKYLNDNNIKYFILGAGSNVILDDYFDGAIIKLDGLNKVEVNDNVLTAGAGAMMGTATSISVNHNLTGLEWAINIPGTIGGSIRGNAGAYNSSIFDNLVKVTVLTRDLEIKVMKKEEFLYSYRYTNIKDLELIILDATFELLKGDKEESLCLIKKRCARRMESQPLDMPSAGSVFRNPENEHAGKLIEDAGLKGTSIGGAEVSEKHANFIVNKGSATSNDIKNLIKLVKEEVKRKFDIDLVLEQEIVDWK